ncbi:Zn-dependent hydrolase [Arthrobacter alpinus]|uniref:Zn-dependent hydrolase n=1 Tax=Arthrobacter alpinus TaxID=656366 RepID=A0A0M4RMW0_9MICC|nr:MULTISPECIES: MBL fold metallo-hydrolase [Arthrobacter]ALE91501.1 Zn-dependent hydrolase [Arthrobacter alpinus]
MSNWQQIGAYTRCLKADNPGPMTLDGTNSYVLAGADSSTVVVVDPGPLLEEHLQALAASGKVGLILITHHHGDHTDGSARLHQLTGAPVRAAHPDFCHMGEPLDDGEVIRAAGLEITVLATPGHTLDSVCFVLADDGGHGSVLTGDTVLGQGSTVICYPDGRLSHYLESLQKLRLAGLAQKEVKALPGHGPVLASLAAAAAGYQDHRRERLAQVSAAVVLLQERTGTAPDATAVTAEVYGDVPANLQGAARLSVEAQLDYLRTV